MQICRCATLFVTLAVSSVGCVGPGMLTDGSSVSVGTTSTGALRNGSRLPTSGDGYRIPRRWRDRRRNYGTNELVQLLVRAARRVNRQHRNSLLGVADLSPIGGGPTLEHRSHRSGRDVDLIFYSVDLNNKPLRPNAMTPFDENGESIQPSSLPSSMPSSTPSSLPADSTESSGEAAPKNPIQPRRLDLARNWALVKAYVLDPKVSVQWIFMDRSIARLLLRYARRRKEPAYIIERAAAVLHHTRAHNDHFHLRVFCAPSDRAHGCVDIGPPRWLKKEIKYIDSPPLQPKIQPRELARLSLRPLRLMGL